MCQEIEGYIGKLLKQMVVSIWWGDEDIWMNSNSDCIKELAGYLFVKSKIKLLSCHFKIIDNYFA